MATQGIGKIANDPPHFEINPFGSRGGHDKAGNPDAAKLLWRSRMTNTANAAETYFNRCIMLNQ